jgi:hypothetical protein
VAHLKQLGSDHPQIRRRWKHHVQRFLVHIGGHDQTDLDLRIVDRGNGEKQVLEVVDSSQPAFRGCQEEADSLHHSPLLR